MAVDGSRRFFAVRIGVVFVASLVIAADPPPELTIVGIEAEAMRPSAALEPDADPSACGGHTVILREGIRLEGTLDVPRAGTYSLWIRVRFGSARGVRAFVAADGDPSGAPVDVARHGQRVIPGDRWLVFAGPWSGENVLRLAPGRIRIRLEVDPGRLLSLPGAKAPVDPLRLDAVFLSTFLDDLRPVTRPFNRLIAAQAEAAEAAEAAAREATYAGDPTRSAPLLEKSREGLESLLSLRERISHLFRLHARACEAAAPNDRRDGIEALTQAMASVAAEEADLCGHCETLLASSIAVLEKSAPAGESEPVPGGASFILSVDDVERPVPYPAASPKWEVIEPLRLDAIAPLAIGRYPGAVAVAEGAYEFGPIEASIRHAAGHGLRTLLLVDPYPPRWLIEKHGRRIQPERAGWGWISIWSAEARSWVAEYLSAYARRFRGRPEIAAYAFWNEPAAAWGEGPDAPPAFRAWLRERHGSIETLAERWGTDLSDFEAISIPPRPGSAPDRSATAGHLCDYLTFRAESFADFFRHAIESLRRGDPSARTMPRFAPSFFSRPADGLDFYRLARAGWDFLSMHDDLWPRALPCGNYIAGMARYGSGALANDECHWVVWEGRETRDEGVLRACARRELWREIAWGKTIVNIERGLQAAWNDWNDSIAEPEHENETLRIAAGGLASARRAADRVLPWVEGARILDDGIGILEPWASLAIAPAPAGRPGGEICRAAGEDLSLWLLRHHLAHRIVPDRAIEDGVDDLSDLEVLLLPYATHLPAEVSQKLLAFARRGGTLIAIGPPGIFDRYGRPVRSPIEALLGPVELELSADRARGWRWIIRSGRPAPDVAVHGRDERGPLIAERRIEKGRAIIAFAPIGGARAFAPAVERAIREAVPVPRASCDAPGVSLVVRPGRAGGIVLFAIQNDPRRPVRTDVRLAGGWKRITDISAPWPIAVAGIIEEDGPSPVTRFPLSLGPGGGAAWRLAPAP
ncbi:MAG: beta-galactosidase [Planctomycetes bacterium]|nr:beta-galactosidase [Planctomycetota bacterium]